MLDTLEDLIHLIDEATDPGPCEFKKLPLLGGVFVRGEPAEPPEGWTWNPHIIVEPCQIWELDDETAVWTPALAIA